MEKSLYSLILMDSVVDEVDKIAARTGTNRSNLVNQILAEYVSMMTPEKRIDNIFREIESLLSGEVGLVPFVSPNHMTMSVKSSLEYKYRPTIKYEVQLYRVPSGEIGELSVIFRTHTQELLDRMKEFFHLWKRLEDSYLDRGDIRYELYDNKFVRSISLPAGKDYSNEQLGTEISEFVRMFDTLMKSYIGGEISAAELERRYLKYLNRGVGLI